MKNPIAEYLDWRRTKFDVGCMFARLIASRPASFGQAVEVLPSNSNGRQLAQALDGRVSALIADPEVVAAALLMPQLESLEELAKALLALNDLPNWSLSYRALNHPDAGELVAVAINRLIPAQQGAMIPSEALVLGPFNPFPPTRYAEQ